MPTPPQLPAADASKPGSCGSSTCPCAGSSACRSHTARIPPHAGVPHRPPDRAPLPPAGRYVRHEDTLLTPGGGNWKLNLEEGQPVHIRLRGRDITARPEGY